MSGRVEMVDSRSDRQTTSEVLFRLFDGRSGVGIIERGRAGQSLGLGGLRDFLVCCTSSKSAN